jgi:hypothetical protein
MVFSCWIYYDNTVRFLIFGLMKPRDSLGSAKTSTSDLEEVRLSPIAQAHQFFRKTMVDLITSLKGSLHNLQKSFMRHGRSNIRIASTVRVSLLWMARVFKQPGIGKKLRDGVKMG